jgi:hypothetical protein
MASGRLSPSAPGDNGSNRVLQEQVTAVNVVAVQTFTRVIMRHPICSSLGVLEICRLVICSHVICSLVICSLGARYSTH